MRFRGFHVPLFFSSIGVKCIPRYLLEVLLLFPQKLLSCSPLGVSLTKTLSGVLYSGWGRSERLLSWWRSGRRDQLSYYSIVKIHVVVTHCFLRVVAFVILALLEAHEPELQRKQYISCLGVTCWNRDEKILHITLSGQQCVVIAVRSKLQ